MKNILNGLIVLGVIFFFCKFGFTVFNCILVIVLIGMLTNEINKNKANAYLAKKHDEEIK